MTPVTPPSNSNGSKKLAKKKGRQESDSEDEWHPDKEEAATAADDDDEEYQDDDDEEDYGSAKKKRKGAPSTPKGKGKGGSSKATPSGGGKGGWRDEEVLEMLKATHRLALLNIPSIAAEPGLKDRSNPAVNMKMRGEFKKIESQWGGDGKWIDNFKLGPSKKSG